jgi:two-component system cell cycle sensor histidine kinase/response regulator CckA
VIFGKALAETIPIESAPGRSALTAEIRDPLRADSVKGEASGDGGFEAVFRAAPVGLLQMSRDGRLLRCNAAVEELFGYDEAELQSRLFGELVCDGERSRCHEFLAALPAIPNHYQRSELHFQRKDGSERSVRIAATQVPGGEGQSWVAMLEDVGGQRMEEQHLREAHKMEAVGRLAGGIAHDFNNLLTGIMLYCDLLTMGLERNQRLRHHAQEIRHAADHGAALIQQLLAVARPHPSEPRIVSVNEVVTEMVEMLGRLIGEHIELVMGLKSGLAAVVIDDAQLKQVLMNLVLNARDAMADGGRITIETANRRARLESEEPAAERDCVAVTVRDTGCGMSDTTRKRLFEPFFTTKAAGKGSGLGLATVYNIVNQNGGRIDVVSESGKGSQFTVLLPAVAARSAGGSLR